jgi:hypothetical protein
LQHGAGSFVIAVWPTDNSYKSEAAYNRSQYIADLLEEVGFTVYCTTTDADAKEKGALKIQTGFGHIKSVCDTDLVFDPFTSRLANIDPVHTVNCMRNRLYDSTSLIYIGDFPAAVADLQLLVDSSYYTKLDHILNESDVSNNDRSHDKMNKQATSRVCSQLVIDLLVKQNHHGTAWYLKLMRLYLNATQDPSMSDERRLYSLRYVTSSLRRWRGHIEATKGKAKDFVTQPVWEAVETMLAVCVKLVADGIGSLLVKLNSQGNEQLFGQMRSSSTRGEFGVNFSSKRGLEIVNDAQVHQHLESKTKNTFNFPSVSEFKDEPFVQQIPLTIDQMSEIMAEAAEDAENDCYGLGIKNDEVQIDRHFSPYSFNRTLLRENLHDGDETEAVSEEILHQAETAADPKVVSFKNCHFLDVATSDGYYLSVPSPTQKQPITLQPKSSLLYAYNTRRNNKSFDRQRRVMNPSRKQLMISGRPHDAQTWQSTGVEIGSVVAVSKGSKRYVGRLISFRYKNQKSKKDTRFPYRNIIFNVNENAEFHLFPLFEVTRSGAMKSVNSKEYFQSEHYKLSMTPNAVDFGTLTVNFDPSLLL